MPTSPLLPYPKAQDVMDRARAYVNDAFRGGAGRILTDQNPMTVQFLNGALETLQRKIRNRGVITLTYDNVEITPCTPNPSPAPGQQQYVAYQGFFNGSVWIATPKLPGNVLIMLDVWERQTGSGLAYQQMARTQTLQDARPGPWLGEWEWRQDMIVTRGSTVSMDLRIRFQGQLAPIPAATAENPLSNITINILASVDALGHNVAYLYARSLGTAPPLLAVMKGDAGDATSDITKAYTRAGQHTQTRRRGFQSGRNGGRGTLPW